MRSEDRERIPHAGISPEEPRASIIIPVRNGSRTLARCLEAIMSSEGFDSLEVIVVDDGSTDSTAEIAATFPVRLIQRPTGSGPAAARNLGAEEARAPRLVFVDADVFVNPETINRLLAELDHVPACFGSYHPEPFYKNFATVFYHTLSCRSCADTSARTAVFYTYCAAIWRHHFLDLGGFDTRFTKATWEDVEFGCRIADRGLHCTHLKDVLVTHAVYYRLPKLARAYFHKSRDLAGLLLSRRALTISDQGWTHRKNWVVLFSALGSLGLAPLAIWSGPFWAFAWAITAMAFLVLSLPIARSIGRRSWAYGLSAVGFYLAVNVIATAGMFAALGSLYPGPSLTVRAGARSECEEVPS